MNILIINNKLTYSKLIALRCSFGKAQRALTGQLFSTCIRNATYQRLQWLKTNLTVPTDAIASVVQGEFVHAVENNISLSTLPVWTCQIAALNKDVPEELNFELTQPEMEILVL